MLAIESLGRAEESADTQLGLDEASYEESLGDDALSDDPLSDDGLSNDALSDSADFDEPGFEMEFGAPPDTSDPRLAYPALPRELGEGPPDMEGADAYSLGPEGVPSEAILPDNSERRLWRINPRPFTRVTYDDNIFISNTNRVADVIWTIGLAVSFELGDFRDLKGNFLIAEWTGAGLLYTQNPDQDAFNQGASLVGRYRWQRLTAGVESRYQSLTGPDRQVGNVARRQLIHNAIHLTYDLTGKIQLTGDASQSAQLYEINLDQFEYQAKVGLDYQIFPKVSLGLEGVAGHLSVQDSPGQSYQQLRLRGKYSLTGKIDIRFNGGVEFREVDDGEPPKAYPALSVGLQYRPFDGTFINAVAYRTVFGSSSSIGQNFIATGFEISIQQSIFQRITVTTAFGYENDSYFGTSQTTQTGRVDNYVFIRPSLSYSLTRHLAFGVFYEFRRNDSNQPFNTFFNNRAGLELSMKL